MDEKDSLPRSQRFVDVDNEADIEMEGAPEILSRIQDSRNNRGMAQPEEHSGFVVLPTKIPLGAIVVFVVQCIVTAVSITSIYVEQKTNTAIQNERISKLEENSYPKIEAQYLTKEVESLKTKVETKIEGARD